MSIVSVPLEIANPYLLDSVVADKYTERFEARVSLYLDHKGHLRNNKAQWRLVAQPHR